MSDVLVETRLKWVICDDMSYHRRALV
ncbi:uncharacterized protein ARMOST_19462 [Armillaria ostoyae]|uniref:Uncharacterized protein n=1 Tax=Armillaria ostoyae TaxID=47428 RepID=A0A284S4M2_ARMOS|nr:uncharacterized protein ARMOST_19462 [Armillaria ostoyae]